MPKKQKQPKTNPAISEADSENPAEDDVWQRLRRPFDGCDLEFVDRISGINSRHEIGRVQLQDTALARRLDEVVGPTGWRLEYDHLGDDLIRCRLTIGEITRDGLGRAADYNEASKMALQDAAAHFGIGAGLRRPIFMFLEKGADGKIKNMKQLEKALSRIIDEK